MYSAICSWVLQDCHLKFLGDISGYFDRPLMLLDPLSLQRTVVCGLNSVWDSSATSPREKYAYSFHGQICIKVDLWLRRSCSQSPLLELKQVTHTTVGKCLIIKLIHFGSFQAKYFNPLSIVSVKICLSYKSAGTSVFRLKGYCFNWPVFVQSLVFILYCQYYLKVKPEFLYSVLEKTLLVYIISTVSACLNKYTLISGIILYYSVVLLV